MRGKAVRTLIARRADVPVARRYPNAASCCSHLHKQFECFRAADLALCVAVRQHGLGVYGAQPAFDREIDIGPIVTDEYLFWVAGL
jgi:hypothetical protein